MAAIASICDLSQRFRKREISPVEVTRECLRRIAEVDPQLNAFITVMSESALQDARQAEAEILRGEWRGPMHGIPVALKDLIDTAGVRTTAASALYKDRIPDADAEVVRRLRQAGAVIIGKNNLHECAYGGSSVVSYFGDAHNPWDVARIAGGSSSGSAASIPAGLACAAIGTDTGGSIREPAALCGCVGIKPTYGRVSARGIIPLSPSLDHIGPLGGSVMDVAIVLQAIAGYDAVDITSADIPVADYVSPLRESAKSLGVGVLRQYFFDDLDSEIASAAEHALRGIETLVANIREIQLNVPTEGLMQATPVQTAEAYAFYAEAVARTPELFQPDTLRRLRKGEGVSVLEYIQRRRELQELRRKIRDVFADVDLLVTPTVPVSTPSIAELKKNPDDLRPAEMKLLRNTRPFNMLGLPAISVPCGFTQAGLPIGLQIAGPHWREDLVLRLAYAYEQATAWHKRKPQLSQISRSAG